MQINKISRTYSRKITINYQSYDFSASIEASPDKPDMTEEEIFTFGETVFNLAKKQVNADIERFYAKLKELENNSKSVPN